MMRNALLAVVAALLLAAPAVLAQETKDADMKGTWVPVEGMTEGKKLPDNFLTSTKLMLGDGKYTVVVGEEKEEGTYKADMAKKPATVDITPTTGPNRGKSIPAIIEVTGDTMRVAYNLTGPDRPKDFNSTADSKFMVMTYKRDKGKEGAAKPPDKKPN